MNSEFHKDSQRSVDNKLSVASGDISPRRMSPELKALVTATVDRLKDEAYRNGRKATARKAELRAAYADMIMKTEGRKVRKYEKATPERRQAQKKVARLNRTPAQIEKEREADKLRKREKAKAQKEAARRDLESGKDYGKF